MVAYSKSPHYMTQKEKTNGKVVVCIIGFHFFGVGFFLCGILLTLLMGDLGGKTMTKKRFGSFKIK